jgi:hypothetical protein
MRRSIRNGSLPVVVRFPLWFASRYTTLYWANLRYELLSGSADR